MNIAVIQSRYNSKRFPGKALALFRGKPLIRFIYDRVRPVVDEVVVGTTHESLPIVDYCRENGIKWVSGSYEDCVGRMLLAAEKGDLVVRLWGDSPLVRPEDIKEYLDKMGGYEFGTTIYPVRTYAKGEDFEVYTMFLLERLDKVLKGGERELIVDECGISAPVKMGAKVLNIPRDYCIDYPEDIERVGR